jgi:hypothetical protein
METRCSRERARSGSGEMERVFRLTAELACMDEEVLPDGTLILEPRQVGQDEFGWFDLVRASEDSRGTH